MQDIRGGIALDLLPEHDPQILLIKCFLNIIEKIPFFLLSVVFGIAAIFSQRTLGAIQDLTPAFSIVDRFFLVSYGVVFYIVKLFVPIDLSAVHAYPIK